MLLNKNNHKINGVNIFQDVHDSTNTNTSDNDSSNSLDINFEL